MINVVIENQKNRKWQWVF